MTSTNEAQLLALAQSGDNAAFDKLIQPHLKKLRSFLASRFPSVDPDDALQETLISAWKHLPGFRSDSSLFTWLYRIANNTACNLFKRRSAKILRDAMLIDSGDKDDIAVQIPDSSTPDLELEAKQRALTIAARLAAMPKELSDALLQYSWDEKPYGEIANNQGVPVGTVRSRIHRARRAVGLPTSSHKRKTSAPAQIFRVETARTKTST